MAVSFKERSFSPFSKTVNLSQPETAFYDYETKSLFDLFLIDLEHTSKQIWPWMGLSLTLGIYIDTLNLLLTLYCFILSQHVYSYPEINLFGLVRLVWENLCLRH